MSRRWLAVAATCVSLTAPAGAADMAQYGNYGYAAPAGPLSWTGFYLGANAGYGWGTGASESPGGFIGGLQGGYNFQFAGSPIVAGLEADFDWSGISAGAFNVDYLGTVRARLGFAFDRVMAYATAGFAYGQGQFEVAGLSNSQSHSGWTIGAGAEFALDRNWSARAEYLYVDLGSSTYSSLIGPASVGYDGNVLRAGVNYRF